MCKLSYIYFSSTDTTKRIVEAIGRELSLPVNINVNIADRDAPADLSFSSDDIVIVGMPVYGGRIPGIAADYLSGISGGGSTAVAVVVYGNRAYDDALLELTDILKACGFNICATAAFVARHSIFPKVAANRPDKADMLKLEEFGKKCSGRLAQNRDFKEIRVKGNHPYKKYGGIPIHPSCSEKLCNKCGLCSSKCPARAIDTDNPATLDAEKCISCGRCIFLCPKKVRNYRGLKYKSLEAVFRSAFSKRKEPEWEIAE